MTDQIAILPLRRLRLERALTQAELVGRLGISQRTIQAIETGLYIPSVRLAVRTARELGLPVETVFTR